jgi:hypothetical protein
VEDQLVEPFVVHGQREAGLIEIEIIIRFGRHGVGKNVRGLIGVHSDERECR